MFFLDCVFCKIVSGEISAQKVFEDTHSLVFLDINPTNEGHCLVIPKKHVIWFHELSQSEAHALIDSTQKTAKAILKALNCRSYNLILNASPIAGGEVQHVHFHVIPRNAKEEFQNWPQHKYSSQDDLESFAEIIKQAFIMNSENEAMNRQ